MRRLVVNGVRTVLCGEAINITRGRYFLFQLSFSKPFLNLLKTLAAVSSLTMLSRITGLLRETLIARTFGVSELTDAFYVAFRMPNLLRRLFAEGAFAQAFVPILGEFKTRKGDDETRALIDAIATVLAWLLTVVSLVGALAAPVVIAIVASGFADQNTQAYPAAVWMTRVMFPYILFISLVAMASGVLNTWKKFAIPAVTPVLLNVAMIAAALLLAPYLAQPIYALAYGVIGGGIAQLALQLPALARIGVLPRISWRFLDAWRHPGVQRVLKQMLPATFAVSVAQLSLIINTNYASRLVAGSVSWLSYADRLMEFPTALLGVALGTILLPSLSRAHADGHAQSYSALLDWGLRLTLLLALPAAVALLVFGRPLTATLFHYGHFSAFDVDMTNRALFAYGLGLMGMIMVKILAPGFYAKQDIRTPVKIAVVVLVATQLVNLWAVPLFGHAGLALSISLGACANALLLLRGLLRRQIYSPEPGWPRFIVQVSVAVIVMGLLLFYLASKIDWVALHASPWLRAILLITCCGLAALSYFGVLRGLGLRLSIFHKKTM
ncbi:MAG: murein biosynthesis integral membrane protein MurJ [Ottowia sp.]|nr:murein biosynthesis integral membrane protein MurJ [Ottowia sp.]